MGDTLYSLLKYSATFSTPEPGIYINISNPKLAKDISSKVFIRLATGKMKLMYVGDSDCLVTKFLSSVYGF